MPLSFPFLRFGIRKVNDGLLCHHLTRFVLVDMVPGSTEAPSLSTACQNHNELFGRVM
jgi:hypothetical protein